MRGWLWAWVILGGCNAGLSVYTDNVGPASVSPVDDEGSSSGSSGGSSGAGSSGSSPGPSVGSSSSSGGTAGTGGTGSSSGATSGSTPVVTLSLTGIAPRFGTNAGGTVVTMNGSFDASTEALFDGQLATVRTQTATTLEVLAPSIAGTGWVDVGVTSGTQSDAMPGEFQYWADAAGNAGSIGLVAYVHLAGGYWSLPGDVAYSDVAMTQSGVPWQWWQEYTPALNTCQFNYTAPGRPTGVNTGTPSMSFQSTSSPASFSLVAGGGPAPDWYGSNLVANTDVAPGESYDLLPMVGNPDWPEFTHPDAVTIPDAFDVTSPPVNGNTLQNVGREATIDWVGGGAGDYVVLYVERTFLNPTTGLWESDGAVTCAVDDTGSFTVPGATWPTWYVDDIVYFNVGRVLDDGGIFPHDDSTNRIAGVYWTVGAAESQ